METHLTVLEAKSEGRVWAGLVGSEKCEGPSVLCVSPIFGSLLVIFGVPWLIGASP